MDNPILVTGFVLFVLAWVVLMRSVASASIKVLKFALAASKNMDAYIKLSREYIQSGLSLAYITSFLFIL